ncbi:MAG: gluP 2 [Gemmataceae bacterium]|nr:gluP 2 [Gemmataceae bacterium]
MVLRWIAAAGAGPWFPSAHAKQARVPRDNLDEPLNELRQAGLVRVADWVRGAGQGYVLTEDGAAVAGTAAPGRAGPADQPAGSDPGWEPRESVIDLRPPVVTLVVLLANLIWFFVGLVIASRLGMPFGSYLWKGDPLVLARLGAVSAPDLLRGEWWRLMTCCFVHGGLPHLVVNMVALGMAGSLAELLWGRWRVLAVYLLSGLAGSCLAMALNPVDEGTGTAVPLVGASGAIWGLLTSLLAWFLIFRRKLPPRLAAEWLRRLGLVFLLNAGFSLLPGISWQAHLGGGVAGFVAAGLLNAQRAGDRPRRVVAVVLLLMLPVLCVGGLVWAMRSGESWAVVRRAFTHSEITLLLAELRPEVVRPVESEVVLFLIRTPDRRAPARKTEIRNKVASLRGAAGQTAYRLTTMTGDATADENRGRERAFARARAKSFDLLLAMIDANTIPDVAAWKAWEISRREADRLWPEID